MSGLPKGYIQLEYIKSTGAQFINTDISVPHASAKIIVQFSTSNLTQDAPVTGYAYGTWGWAANMLFVAGSKAYVNGVSIGDVLANQKYEVEYTNSYFKINGVQTSKTFTGYTDGYNNTVFYGNGRYGQYMVYSYKLYNGSTLIRDFVPAKRSSDGVLGLYDLVTNAFYVNAGTGEFIAGPVVIVPTAPGAPGNFRVASESDTEITLAWDAVENAAGYLVRQNGALIVDTPELTTTAKIQLFKYYSFEVSAYNELGEGDRSMLAVFRAPENPQLWLVTNRTAQDVAARNNKGMYQASDLIRVGAAVNLLRGLFESAGFVVNVLPKLTWTETDWMNAEGAARYLADIEELRSKLAARSTTPKTPESLEQLTYTKANHIEQILLDVYTQYLTMLTTRVTAGPATSGGDYL